MTEVKQVWHQVAVREHHAFISELVEPGMCQGIDWLNTLVWLIDEHLRQQVNRIDVCILVKNLRNDKFKKSNLCLN